MVKNPLQLSPVQDSNLFFIPKAQEFDSHGVVRSISTMSSKCTVSGGGTSSYTPNEEALLTVQAVDKEGNAREEGGDRVDVVGFPELKEGDVRVVDNGDGSYLCGYTARDDLLTRLHVNLNGSPVGGSPFAISAGKMCTYSGLFDTNGVLYWIGTGGGTRGYTNPHTSGDVVVSWSSCLSGSEARCIEHKCGWIWNNTRNEEGSWVCVDLGSSRRLAINYYSLRYGRSDNTGFSICNWELAGSNDQNAWVCLRAHNNDSSLDGAMAEASWAVEGKGEGFRYFRIKMTGKNSDGRYYLSCAGMELYGRLTAH